jgi:DNA-binding GntR family transcriptional regulator
MRNIAMTESTTSDKLEILRTQSLASVVYEEIERMIVEGELGGGDRINEKVLAEQQGMSRGPIREACRRLEEAGLVEIKRNRGVFVRKLAFDDVIELYEIRAALCGFAGRILAQVLTEIEQLDAPLKKMRAFARSGDLKSYYPLNLEFHSLLMAFTGNKRLARLYEATNKELHLYRRRTLLIGSNLEESCNEHQAILDALRGGNPRKISKAMRLHCLDGRSRLLQSSPHEAGARFLDLRDDDDE